MWKEQTMTEGPDPFYELMIYHVHLFLALGDQAIGDLRYTSGKLCSSG